MKTIWIKLSIAILAVGGMQAMTACDDAETGTVLRVSPANSEISGAGVTVVFTASSLSDEIPTNRNEMLILPIQWSVRYRELGGIISSKGYTAVYQSNGPRGQNVVFARDALGREGLAVINQR